MSTTKYIAGLMFDQHMGNMVALVRKNRPAALRGKLNAIGGHVEEGETVFAAMVREFREETGLDTIPESWKRFAIVTGEGYEVTFFVSQGPTMKLRTSTDEEIVCKFLDELSDQNTVPDVLWLIPMALQRLKNVGTQALNVIQRYEFD